MLEICIVERGGCFEWFPSVNQIPQKYQDDLGMVLGWFLPFSFFISFFLFGDSFLVNPSRNFWPWADVYPLCSSVGARLHQDRQTDPAAALVLRAARCCRRRCCGLDLKAVEKKWVILSCFWDTRSGLNPSTHLEAFRYPTSVPLHIATKSRASKPGRGCAQMCMLGLFVWVCLIPNQVFYKHLL